MTEEERAKVRAEIEKHRSKKRVFYTTRFRKDGKLKKTVQSTKSRVRSVIHPAVTRWADINNQYLTYT